MTTDSRLSTKPTSAPLSLPATTPAWNSSSESWRELALCQQVDPELWFPDKGDKSARSKPAKLLCSQCEVKAPCLQYALDHDERYGIWGGKSERDRRKMKSRTNFQG